MAFSGVLKATCSRVTSPHNNALPWSSMSCCFSPDHPHSHLLSFLLPLIKQEMPTYHSPSCKEKPSARIFPHTTLCTQHTRSALPPVSLLRLSGLSTTPAKCMCLPSVVLTDSTIFLSDQVHLKPNRGHCSRNIFTLQTPEITRDNYKHRGFCFTWFLKSLFSFNQHLNLQLTRSRFLAGEILEG